MGTSTGTEAIDDDELLYRRIPQSREWYDPAKDPLPSLLTFRPREFDLTGLSLFRAKYKSLREVAKGQHGKKYFVAVLRAGDLRACGIDVLPQPRPEDPGHCEIPSLVYETRRETESLEKQKRLAHELCLRVEGPFG